MAKGTGAKKAVKKAKKEKKQQFRKNKNPNKCLDFYFISGSI